MFRAQGHVLIHTCVRLVFLGRRRKRKSALLVWAHVKEATMASLNQQTSPHGNGSGYGRWLAVAVVIAAVAVGVVLLVIYGGGGSAPGY
jgi:hypothetical protein